MHLLLEAPAADQCSALTADKLVAVVKDMRQDPALEFKTNVAAARLGVAPDVFIRAFKQVTGLSPQRFRAALRIERAKHLLVDTDRSVTEISLDIGYSSLGTFVRTFTALVGVAPGQLRRLARGDIRSEGLSSAISAFGSGRSGVDTKRLRVRFDSVPCGRLVAIGLFPQSLPAGLPFDGCFLDPSAPQVQLAWPAQSRRVTLLAAAIGPFCMSDAWAGRLPAMEVCSLRVGASDCAAREATLRLQLRRAVETDPPFLTPVPLLILLQSGRSATKAPLL